MSDGTTSKVLIRVPYFRNVRPTSLIVSEEDDEPVMLSAEMIYEAARNGEHGLKPLEDFPIHSMN